MKYTSNHNFKLPAPSDTIDVEVLNENFVNIDSLIKTLESAKADKNSPSFTGAPTAPTASSSTNSTQIATTAFVQGLIQGIQTALSGKADKNSPSFTGTSKSPTPPSSDISTSNNRICAELGASSGQKDFRTGIFNIGQHLCYAVV